MALLFSFKSDDVNNEMLQMRKPNVVNSTDLKNILSNPELCRLWFPDERMMVSWVPYRLMSENVDVIMKPNMYIVADQSDTSTGRGLMSAGGSYIISGSLLYYLDIYGTNTTTLSNHVAAHMQHIMNMNVKNVNLITYAHPTIPSKELADTMNLFGLSVNTMFYNKAYLLERTLNKG